MPYNVLEAVSRTAIGSRYAMYTARLTTPDEAEIQSNSKVSQLKKSVTTVIQCLPTLIHIK